MPHDPNLVSMCRLASMTPAELSRILGDAGGRGVEITAHNRTTDLLYLIRTVSRMGDKYLVEMYEIHDDLSDHRQIIFRNWVRVRLRARRPGLAGMLGMMILLGVAGAAGSAFYLGVMDAVDTAGIAAEAPDVVSYRILKMSDLSRNGLAWIELRTGHADDIRIAGDIVEIRLTDDIGGAVGGAEVHQERRGWLVRYEGMVEFARSGVSPGDAVVVEVSGRNMSALHAMNVGGP